MNERISTSEYSLLRGVAKIEANRLRESVAPAQRPIPVKSIAEYTGAEIIFTETQADGYLHKEGDTYTIHVDRNAIQARQRFTLAHEIGHIVFDRLTNTESLLRYRWRKMRPTSSTEELFCDLFASHLLIPEESIQDLCMWQTISLERMLTRAKELGVSFSALARRVVEALPDSGGVLWFRRMGRPTDGNDIKWRVHWGFFPKERYKHPFRYASIPSTSIIHPDQMLPGEAVYRNVSLEFCAIKDRRSVMAVMRQKAMLALVFPGEMDADETRTPGQIAFNTTG